MLMVEFLHKRNVRLSNLNFRECRMVTLYEIMNYACSGTISMEKAFLMLGGIRNGIYYFKLDNIQVIGTGGAEEINCPGIFELLHIEYSVLEPQQFLQQLDEKVLDENRYFYVVPVLPEILNKGIQELGKIGTFGQSFFIIEEIRDGKIYLKFDQVETYLDIEVLRTLTIDEKWVIESSYGIYRIDKMKLKTNEFLHKLGEISTKKLLLYCVKRFTKSSKMEGDFGTVRIDGPEVYALVCKHFADMRDFLEKQVEEKKRKAFTNYVYIQCLHYRKFLLSGTDAYYRNEFHYILNETFGQVPKFSEHLKKWDELEAQWRNHGRMLSKCCTYRGIMENSELCLNNIVEFWEKIGQTELEVIEECKKLLREQMIL